MITRGVNITERTYEGGFEYADDTLSLIHTGEGFVQRTSTGFTYNYFLKDHLGNNRVVFGEGTGGQLVVSQTTDYYPFGAAHEPTYESGTDNKYLYNGKERQDDMLGGISLDWYDYGARFYDPQIGRWHAVDPLAEKYFSYTPYNYVVNNPLNFVDPDGRDAKIITSKDKDGNIVYTIQSTIYITGKGASEKKADQLTQYAGKMLTSSTISNDDGTSTIINFNVNYKYSETIQASDLKDGENLLVGLTTREAQNAGLDASKVSSNRYDAPSNSYVEAGRVGYMVGGFNSNTSIHESMHLIGLSDRYTDNPQTITVNGVTSTSRNSTPHTGFESDIMNGIGGKKIHYTHFQNYKTYFNQNIKSTEPFILRRRVDINRENGTLIR